MSNESLNDMTIAELLDYALSNTKLARDLILKKIADAEGLVADEFETPMDHLTGAKNLDKGRRAIEAANHARKASNELHALSTKYRALAFRELDEARLAASIAAGNLADKR